MFSTQFPIVVVWQDCTLNRTVCRQRRDSSGTLRKYIRDEWLGRGNQMSEQLEYVPWPFRLINFLLQSVRTIMFLFLASWLGGAMFNLMENICAFGWKIFAFNSWSPGWFVCLWSFEGQRWTFADRLGCKIYYLLVFQSAWCTPKYVKNRRMMQHRKAWMSKIL